MTAWKIEFNYIESCNCAAACPCPFTGAPTQGHCDLVMGFHIVRGTFGSVSLKGRTAVMVVDVPGNMRAGGYRTGIYVDDGGDTAQRAAVEAIFTRKVGGVFESLAALTDEWLGVKHVSIEMSTRRSVLAVPQALDIAYEPYIGIGGRTAGLVNSGQRHATGKKLKVGYATVSRITDFGFDWDNEGGRVFFGRYAHSDECAI